MLKNIRHLFFPVLSTIIKNGCSLGVFSHCLKQGKITTVFKCGDATILENYRLISVLALLSQIFEKCFYIRIYNFSLKHSLISPEKFGFQSGKSTEQAVTKLIEMIYDPLNSNRISLAVFVHYSKASDTVNHAILLGKLYLYGFQGLEHSLISSYLTNRSHVTRIGTVNILPFP